MAIRSKEFRREDHVYVNTQFSELLKDALRFFHGMPVLPLPPSEPFKGVGVYAIYCIAKKGIYKAYGEKLNRKYYDVPIYVGKAVPSGSRQKHSQSFKDLNCGKQIAFWCRSIKATIGMSLDDFRFRVCNRAYFGPKRIDGVYDMLLQEFHPVWNDVFALCDTDVDIFELWSKIHSIRFHSKADKSAQESLKRFLEVA